MKMVYVGDEEEVIEFAKLAAKDFGKNPEHITFTNGDIEAGCLFALRFGFYEDCVVVFKLDDEFEPINFKNIVDKKYSKNKFKYELKMLLERYDASIELSYSDDSDINGMHNVKLVASIGENDSKIDLSNGYDVSSYDL